LANPLDFALRQGDDVVKVHEGFQQRADRVVGRCFTRFGDLAEQLEGVAELPQGFGVLLLLAADRAGLQVDLVAEGHELAEEGVQIDRFRWWSARAGGASRRGGGFGEPRPEIREDVVNGFGAQVGLVTASKVSSDTRRRGLRHEISSMMASTLSFFPASNRR
jgi:hypothetical protein